MLGQQLRSFGRRWLSRTPPKSACCTSIELNSTCKHEKTLATTILGSSGGGVRARVPWLCRFFICRLVIERTFGSAKLFGRTSTVRFGPNDRTFFCRTQNFFSYYSQCQWHLLIFLFCSMTHMFMALSLVFR